MGSESPPPTDTPGPNCGDGSISGGEEFRLVPSACCRFVSPLEGSHSSVSSHSSAPSHLLTLHTVTVSAARHLRRLIFRNDKIKKKKGGCRRFFFRLFFCDFFFVFFLSLFSSLVQAADIRRHPRVRSASLAARKERRAEWLRRTRPWTR